MECLKNKKGVSPVIGVLLMVVVTVILAAIIASFIFGMGTKMKSAPQVQLYLEDAPGPVNTSSDNELFIVTHYGGDDLILKDIKLQVLNATKSITLTWDGTKFSGGGLEAVGSDIEDGILSAGESFKVCETGTQDVFNSSPDILTLRVIHIPTGTVIFEGSVRVY